MLYIAVWFDVEEQPGRQVVVCAPPVESASTAEVVLQGALHKEHPALIVGGEAELLENFIAEVERRDDKWIDATMAVQQTVALVKNMGLSLTWIRQPEGIDVDVSMQATSDKRPANGPPVPPDHRPPFRDPPVSQQTGVQDGIDPLFGRPYSNAAVTAKKAKAAGPKWKKTPPRKASYPPYINHAAKPLWDITMTEAKAKIQKDGNRERSIADQWAVALLFFEAFCARYRIAPWSGVPTEDKPRDYVAKNLAEKIRDANKRADDELLIGAKKALAAGLISKIGEEEWGGGSERYGRWRIMTTRQMTLPKSVSPREVRQFLMSHHNYFPIVDGDNFIRKTVDGMAEVTWGPPDGAPERLMAWNEVLLTGDQVLAFLGPAAAQNDIDVDDFDTDETVALLRVVGKHWFKTGKLTPKTALKKKTGKK